MPDNRRAAAPLVIAATIDVFWLGKTASDVRWITQIAVFRAQIDNFVSFPVPCRTSITLLARSWRRLKNPRPDTRSPLTYRRAIR